MRNHKIASVTREDIGDVIVISMVIQYIGNKKLLEVSKTAFLAASTIPPDMVLKCYDWAVRMANEGQCVISGFSSHLEREVLHFLMKGRQPIILVLARELYKDMPPELNKLLDENRLLIISVSEAVRQSKATAYARNKYICEIANQILMVGVNEKSSLFTLYNQFSTKLCPIE